MLCPRTGLSVCHCPKPPRTKTGGALLADLKVALRRVFTEHTWYTSDLIVASLPDLKADDSSIITKRILQNPIDIGNLLRSMINPDIADEVEEAFTQHLKLAAAALESVRKGDNNAIKKSVNNLIEQGNTVAEVLSDINPEFLSMERLAEEFKTHNEFVVELATLRANKQHAKYIEIFDAYRAHMDRFSDLLYAGLISA